MMKSSFDPLQITDATGIKIREEILRDPIYPLHKISEKLRPYLCILVEQFHPEKVFVFGSYAYGEPNQESDIDILVVKPIQQSRVKDKVAIRSAWWPLLRQGSPISLDLMLIEPEESNRLQGDANSYYSEIISKGLQVV